MLLLKFNVLYIRKTHFDCFNSQVNNLDDMNRKIFFIDIKQYFGKFQRSLISSRS